MSLYLVPIIILIPLIGFLINGLWGRHFSKKMIATLGVGAPLGSLFLFLFLFLIRFFSGPSAAPLNIDLFTWNAIPPLAIHFSLLFDSLSSFMCFIILFIGTLIHLYSVKYMEEESPPHYARYFSYLNLFIFFMLILVLSANLWVMFIGWEGVGLASFLLIGYWFQKSDATYSSIKAFVVNRIGDLGFISALFLLINFFPGLDFASLNQHPELISKPLLEVITLSLFFAATAKSAQIPLHIWLADAMTGPSPVSALIHAATMVTAGIFMICRLSPLYELSLFTTPIIGYIGAFTALMGAILACQESHLKRILAFSTVSQLGNMFVAIGVHAFIPALFHLFTHAFFKAALFLSAGAVIHSFHGEQEIAKMGGAYKSSPLNGWAFLISSLSLAAFPFTSGFVSKEGILHAVSTENLFLLTILLMTSFLTSFYIARTYFCVFMGERNNKSHKDDKELHSISYVMLIPVVILSFLSLVLALPSIHTFVQHFLSATIHREELLHTSSTLLIPLISIGGTCCSFLLAYWIIIHRKNRSFLLGVFSQKFYFDYVYEQIIYKYFSIVCKFVILQFVEKIVLEGLQTIMTKISMGMSRGFRYTANGHIQMYSLVAFTGILSVILWCLYV